MRFQKITQPYRARLKLVERISVARVQPRTSKGITDLLLPQTSLRLKSQSPSKKQIPISEDTSYYLAGYGLVR